MASYPFARSRTLMSLAGKLQIRPGQTLHIQNAPGGLELDLPESAHLTDSPEDADALLIFVKDSAELAADGGPFLDAARRDALAWVAYPKARQLGTDLNRDILWRSLQDEGVRPVRQISLDDVWSALRFRPS